MITYYVFDELLNMHHKLDVIMTLTASEGDVCHIICMCECGKMVGTNKKMKHSSFF